jgi:GT2 family glycosyltransferase
VDRNAETRERGTPAGAPGLSVILATPGPFATVARTVAHLRRQTIRERLELLLVAPSRERLELDAAAVDGFAAVRVVETGEFRSVGRANAAGVRAAVAAVVALAEDHCFPDPDWAERLLAAHAGPWAAVGPGVRNANPGSAVSWADLLIGYGPWLLPSPARDAEFLPGHNSSYKRDLLLALGDRLEERLEAETLLHWELRAAGHRLRFEPAAAVAHTNFSRWRSWVPAQFHNGRLFAGLRARGRSPGWRALYAAGSPLIPAVRLLRIWRGLPSREIRRRGVAALPALAVGLAVDALGQLLGYAFGVGAARDRVARYEVDRFRHLRAADRAAAEGGA